MKLFKQLLVAPAALGLLAPLAANAEVNIQDVSSYTAPGTEVSTSQFSDVVPGDWAYTALQNLSESTGCVNNAYTQNLKSGQPLTRYEAAALLNECLKGGIASADVDRLSNEFGTEMAVLKGRVDGLEYRVEELSAGAYAPMTKISGSTQFTTGFHDTAADTNDNKWTTEYNYKIDINHQFTGDDNLYIGLEAGNQNELVLEGQVNEDEEVGVESLFYSFPIGEFRVHAGPLLDQDDVVSATTSIYSSEFYIAELPWSLSGNTGAGVTVEYRNDNGWNASVNGLAQNNGAATATTGMFTEEGTDEYTASIGYDSTNWGGGVIYRSVDVVADDTLDSSLAVGFYFRPDDWPTFSIAYDKLDDENGTSRGDLFFGLDYGIGSGQLSAALQANDNVINNDTENKQTIEVYYTYPINDGMDVKAGVYSQELTGGVDNTQGAIVETTFRF